jgi:hypothetical protein
MEDLLEQVKRLRDSGLKRKEIAERLNISIRKVDRLIAELKKKTPVLATESQGITEDRLREIIREELAQREDKDESRLPLVLKTGKGQEVISPEGIIKYYLLGDGDAGEAMLKGMMLLRAAQLMVMNDVEIMKGQAEAQAAAIKPILDIMEKAREDMDAAAQRAKESGAAIAEAAAAGAAARATMRIDERFNQLMQQKPDIATVQDPMKGLMARTMEMMMNRMQSLLFGGQGGQVPPTPGLVDKRFQQQGG